MDFFKFILFILIFFKPLYAEVIQSLQDKINQSPPGGVIYLEPGIYKGGIEINHPIEIRGQKGVIIDALGIGSVVSIKSNEVKLYNLEIRNSGKTLGNNDSGIKVESGQNLVLENIKISNTLFGIQLSSSSGALLNNIDIEGYHDLKAARRGDAIKAFSSHNLKLINSRIRKCRDVILLYSNFSEFKNNLIEKGRYGIHFMYSQKSLVQDNHIMDNSVGIYVMYSHDVKITGNKILRNRGPSGFGIGLKEADRFLISNNNFVGNREGIHIDNSPISRPKELSDYPKTLGNRFSQNDIGIYFVGHGEKLIFEQNDFLENWLQVSSEAGRKASGSWAKNYWSDYTGVDLNNDGAGEFPYRLRGLFNNLTERYEGFKIFDFGPTMLALNFSEKLIPWFRDDSKLEDKSPAVAPYSKPPPTEISYGYLLIFLLFSLLVILLIRIGNL